MERRKQGEAGRRKWKKEVKEKEEVQEEEEVEEEEEKEEEEEMETEKDEKRWNKKKESRKSLANGVAGKSLIIASTREVVVS